MNFTQAVASGKAFRRTSVGGDYLSLDEFTEAGLSSSDVLAGDYELEPDVTITVSKATFDAAWNAARSGMVSIKPAGTSEFYKKLSATLGIS